MPTKHFFTLCLMAVSLSLESSPLFAENLNQAESLRTAEMIHHKASDESLQNSTTNAMRALMDLAKGNRSVALSNAYKAYGQYRDSDNLDNLRVDEKIKQIKLGSGAGAKEAASYDEYNTSYRRLNPKFLREGEADGVAEEFERRSGMKRDDFLKAISNASDSSISPNDPEMVDKAFSRFEAFAKGIPNTEFRARVLSNINAVPSTIRVGLLAKAVQKIAQSMASLKPGKKNSAIGGPGSPLDRIPAMEPLGLAGSTSISAAFTASANPLTPAVKPILPSDSGYKGLAKENFSAADPIGSVINAALEEQGNDSIFRQVSKRYRAMTPFFDIR